MFWRDKYVFEPLKIVIFHLSPAVNRQPGFRRGDRRAFLMIFWYVLKRYIFFRTFENYDFPIFVWCNAATLSRQESSAVDQPLTVEYSPRHLETTRDSFAIIYNTCYNNLKVISNEYLAHTPLPRAPVQLTGASGKKSKLQKPIPRLFS